MNIRTLLAGAALAAVFTLTACHKSDVAGTNQMNAATELSAMADTNANDETMNEDSGNQTVVNAN